MSLDGHPSPLAQSCYRPDIDGLRAIAIIGVLVFHAFPTLLQGGFVGVDIFFVISGYLISKHILTDLAAGTFTVGGFYARRIRRIFPALSVVLLACGVIGWFILTPVEYKQLGKHMAGGAGFISNILYGNEAGYFDDEANTKPLLHLWSLGVEEQFYIVWPLLLAFLWRKQLPMARYSVGIFSLSLLCSLILAYSSSVKGFYLPFTRFWELMLGGGLAYAALYKPGYGDRHASLMSWSGLFLILASLFLLDKEDHFPGVWALLPTLGAALMIQGGEKSWLNTRILASPSFVWMGLVSYPLYLWHWPLLSFTRILKSTPPTSVTKAGLIVISVVLAWLTYRLLERPIRSRPACGKIIVTLSLIMVLLGGSGFVIKKMDGVRFRQFAMVKGDLNTLVLNGDHMSLRHGCAPNGESNPLFDKAPFDNCLSDTRETPRYAVMGDSKAGALFYGLVRESEPGHRWMMVGSGDPPSIDAAQDENDKQEVKKRFALQMVIDNADLEMVVFAMAMRGTFTMNADTGFIEGDMTSRAAVMLANYSQAIHRLEEAGKRVVFFTDHPTFPDPRNCVSFEVTSNTFLKKLLQREENPRCSLKHSDHMRGTQVYREWLVALAKRNPGLTVYDPTPLLCDISSDMCTVTKNGNFLYHHTDHLSDYGNSLVARDMLQRIVGEANGMKQKVVISSSR